MTAPKNNDARKPLIGRVALVTGASRGIGAAVAKAYAQAGAHVILLARTVGALEEVDDAIQSIGGHATLMPLDLDKPEQIAAAAPAIAERFRRLDILVANAGILGPMSPVALSDPRPWEGTFKTNLMANYHLIRALDPLLRGSDAGRALFVTATEQANAPFFSAYAASKAALEAMVRAYAAEVAYSPLRVNLIDPGPVRTELRADAYPGEDTAKLKTPDDVAGMFVELASPDWVDTGKLVKAA